MDQVLSRERGTASLDPGVDHAFNNDTGERYNETQATAAWKDTLAWFGQHV
ncbi:dienelactone hydrolase family protein [Pseudarthrobacter sp. AL07]|uniref:dienelactone hydrolase family protein n=1 Tax=unclassified Pseudarthrobacter TaxID=2647000 RepID=UPI002499F938|nr:MULTISPECIES: dienelactone hydrolase family protein [unclassified Pseudarthrobacter]MDI3195767.1 dienelactone hydrolase family protein [Pseudarthrobacter sp. AL20]MDI3209881.1 dienelactone hydrolase family protein [Pseudarthrobacter sp. AL07]